MLSEKKLYNPLNIAIRAADGSTELIGTVIQSIVSNGCSASRQLGANIFQTARREDE